MFQSLKDQEIQFSFVSADFFLKLTQNPNVDFSAKPVS